MNQIQPSRSRSFTPAMTAVAVLAMQGLVTSESQAREREATATGPQGQSGSVEVTRTP